MCYNKHMRKKFYRSCRAGFTLVELSFSLVFIGILSVAVALIINNAVQSYRRGLTLNNINSTGMDLVDDMRAAVQNSAANAVTSLCSTLYKNSGTRAECEKDGARNFVSVERLATVKVGGVTRTNVPVFGAFCTGAYSYIWNSGYLFGNYDVSVGKASFVYKNTSGGTTTVSDFRLLKVHDETRAVCMAATFGATATKYEVQRLDNYASVSTKINGSAPTTFNIAASGTGDSVVTYPVIDEAPVELLSGREDSNLAFYDLRAAAPAANAAGNGLFYSVSFILGTVQGGVDVMKTGNNCAPPEDYENENFNYCAINKFNFAVQATGGYHE